MDGAEAAQVAKEMRSTRKQRRAKKQKSTVRRWCDVGELRRRCVVREPRWWCGVAEPCEDVVQGEEEAMDEVEEESKELFQLLAFFERKGGRGTIVWVVNREKPATNNNFVVLLINKTANNTVLLSQNNKSTVLWSVNIARKPKNPILQLLDSGNLVLREENDENEEKNYLWQSFDYPGDTLLPRMKLGKDLRTGFDRCVTAWKNENGPSPGTLNWHMDVTTWPEPMQWIGIMKQYNNGLGMEFKSVPNQQTSLT
ncbi:S-locus-specific glycoprotein S6-like [Arachis duranensis]|uniref:S-locus-specific glycoprotein S6-like n=1 Tax=Arachis duranensis TaxID=130453 RepID=A0A9C6WK28_ARADU|nr:S-locus-specific glycoprotein S6-like [Arachis duranensis]